MTTNEVHEILNESINEVDPGKDPKNMSLESLVLLLTTERLHRLEEESRTQLKELRERQEKVSFLHKLTKTINAATSATGELNLSPFPELPGMIKEAKSLGLEVDENKLTYTTEERERLIENLRMTTDDLNVQNDMQLQIVTRMTNERYESYQMARSILKPLHDVKMKQAGYMGGR